MARARPDPRLLSEGCPLTPLAKATPRESLLRAIPGRAKQERGGPSAAAPSPVREPRRPAGHPNRGALPAPRAPARAAPARRRRWGPTAFCVPVGVERSRTERQTGSPIAIAFICPPPYNQAPPRLAGRERAPVQSQGPPGAEALSQPQAEAPAELGRAGLVTRARPASEGRCYRVEAPCRLFVLMLKARSLSEVNERPVEPETLAAGARRAGWGGGNRPEGGTARSRLLAGTAASEFPGRRGGAVMKAKFEAVQNSRVVTVSTAALFSARRAEAWAGRWVHKSRWDALWGSPALCRERSRDPPALRWD